MNLLCFLSIYGNSPTGEKHSLDSTHLFYMLHRFWSCSVFTWILNLLCARVSSWIHSIWWTYSWCKIHSTFCICFTMFTSFYFQPGANSQFGFAGCTNFVERTLAAKRVTHTMERPVLEKIVEMTEIIHATSQRSKWTNSQICCLWLYFCDIYASPKSSMQGVFHSYRMTYDFAEGP